MKSKNFLVQESNPSRLGDTPKRYAWRYLDVDIWCVSSYYFYTLRIKNVFIILPPLFLSIEPCYCYCLHVRFSRPIHKWIFAFYWNIKSNDVIVYCVLPKFDEWLRFAFGKPRQLYTINKRLLLSSNVNNLWHFILIIFIRRNCQWTLVISSICVILMYFLYL